MKDQLKPQLQIQGQSLTNIKAISHESHSQKFWHPVKNYNFTSKDVLCSLVAHEVPEACLSLPIAFSKVNDKYIPVAVLGLKHGQNLVLDKNGSWRAPYVPRIYRCYPFSLAVSGEERILCIDEVAAETDSLNEGEAFFINDEVSPTLVRILEFLNTNVENSVQTEQIFEPLNESNLIEPWPLEVVIDGETLSINGLYRVNEDELNKVSAIELAALRDSRALVVMYSQLVSMSHMKNLVRLAQSQEDNAIKELVFDDLDNGGTIDFSNL